MTPSCRPADPAGNGSTPESSRRLAAAAVIDARAERQARSRPGPRSRRVYLALAGTWLLPVAGMAVLLTTSGGRQPSWRYPPGGLAD